MVLWFDVEKKNYTTKRRGEHVHSWLWFDVEKKNYTTTKTITLIHNSCGLM